MGPSHCWAESQAQQESARSVQLQLAVEEAQQAQVELHRRMQAAREAMEAAQAQSALSEEGLRIKQVADSHTQRQGQTQPSPTAATLPPFRLKRKSWNRMWSHSRPVWLRRTQDGR